MCLNYFSRLLPLFMIALLVFTIEAISQNDVQITIDASSTPKPISPWIYGRNNSLSKSASSPVTASQWQRLRDAGVNMLREGGGNNSTKYNWRRKMSSHPDWYNNVYAQDWDYAARTLQQNLPHAQGLWTLGLIGWAAKTNAHNFGDWAYNQSKWWSGVNQNLAGGGVLNPEGGSKALKDGNPSLYLEEWPVDSVVGILKHWFGESGIKLNPNNFLYWNMDNEPEIWNGTHDDVMPVMISAEEFMQRYFETAKKARAIFPDIKIAGPVPANEWQWYNWNGNRISYKGRNHVWLEYFIRRVAEEQAESGIRLLDVLDIHFYPGETNVNDIVQSHRVYFDRNYVYPGANGVKRLGASGWDSSINKEYIFGRCADWLVQYMGKDHGVTFGVTETAVKTSDPNVIAVWYASMLGEFSKQGVEIFTPWDWKVGMWETLHLFTRFNYDSYIPSVSSQEEFVSAYPTINQDGDSVSVVLVNRSVDQVKTANVTVNNFNFKQQSVPYYRINSLGTTETFVSKTQNALKTGTVDVTGNVVSISLPPMSVTTLVASGTKTVLGNKPEIRGNIPEIMVFPNPAHDYITVRVSPDFVYGATISVYNTLGNRMFSGKVSGNDFYKSDMVIDISGWNSGLYIVAIESGDFKQQVKLTVQAHQR